MTQRELVANFSPGLALQPGPRGFCRFIFVLLQFYRLARTGSPVGSRGSAGRPYVGLDQSFRHLEGARRLVNL